MIGLMMTTKLPFLFGGGESTLLFPSTSAYYLYHNVNSEGTGTTGVMMNQTRTSSTTGAALRAASLNGSSLGQYHPALKQLLQPPLANSISTSTARMNHFYGVLAAMSSLIFASAVFIFIRKAKGFPVFSIVLFEANMFANFHFLSQVHIML